MVSGFPGECYVFLTLFKAMEDEITGREPVVEQVKATGQQMVENGHYASDTITSRLSNLDNKWASARDTAAYRKRKLQDSSNVQQVGNNYYMILRIFWQIWLACCLLKAQFSLLNDGF
jgi:hypothetical protein